MAAGIDIRGGLPADASDIAGLLGQLGYPMTAREAAGRMEAVAGDPTAAMLVATGWGPVVGVVAVNWCAMLHRPARIARITTLVVDDAARGTGVGRMLVKAASQWARTAGCDTLELTSGVQRHDAHAFYRAIGFENSSLRFSRSLRRRPAAGDALSSRPQTP